MIKMRILICLSCIFSITSAEDSLNPDIRQLTTIVRTLPVFASFNQKQLRLIDTITVHFGKSYAKKITSDDYSQWPKEAKMYIGRVLKEERTRIDSILLLLNRIPDDKLPVEIATFLLNDRFPGTGIGFIKNVIIISPVTDAKNDKLFYKRISGESEVGIAEEIDIFEKSIKYNGTGIIERELDDDAITRLNVIVNKIKGYKYEYSTYRYIRDGSSFEIAYVDSKSGLEYKMQGWNLHLCFCNICEIIKQVELFLCKYDNNQYRNCGMRLRYMDSVYKCESINR